MVMVYEILQAYIYALVSKKSIYLRPGAYIGFSWGGGYQHFFSVDATC